MNIKDIRFAPTHAGKFGLLQSLHVALGPYHMRCHDNHQLGALQLLEIITKKILQYRNVAQPWNLPVLGPSAACDQAT